MDGGGVFGVVDTIGETFSTLAEILQSIFFLAGYFLTLRWQNIWMVEQSALQPFDDTALLSDSHHGRERYTRLLYSTHIVSTRGIPQIPHKKYGFEWVELLWRCVPVRSSLSRFPEARGTGFWKGKTGPKNQRRGIC